MELICPHCGRNRLWYDPYTGNFDCTTCGTPILPEELTCPLCGKVGSLRAEDGILCCGSCGEVEKSETPETPEAAAAKSCATSAWRKRPWTTIMMRSSAAMMENPPARSGTEWTISRNSGTGQCPSTLLTVRGAHALALSGSPVICW